MRSEIVILRARIVVPMAGAPIEDGLVVVDGDHIVSLGERRDLVPLHGEPTVDLGEVALLPGLINGHCHLDYTMMRHAIDPPRSFTAWVQRINALKRSLDNRDYLDAIRQGFRELRKWGTTSVCNIEAFPELMVELGPSPLRTWWFYEMIDVRHRNTTEEVVAGALSFFRRRAPGLDRFGLSPHAPFTASVSLYQLANACALRSPMALTTHCAESREEMEMFREARGPLFDFMKSLQRPMNDCGRQTPFGLLWRSGAIDRHWLLAHMNELRDEDFELLGQQAVSELPSVIHCPGSHRYFNHSPFPLQRLLAAGVNVCVGTDSLASTESLSLLEELRCLRKAAPGLSGEQLLQMITVNPAHALQQTGQLGRIAPGALADLIAVPAAGTVVGIYDEIVNYAAPISWMMIDGQIVP